MIIEADLIRRLDDLHERLLKLEYPEPETGVQKPERWKDVTEACEVMTLCDKENTWAVRHQDGGEPGKNVLIKRHGYRLRKVRLYWAPMGPENGQDAFIIERREE